MRRKPFVLTAIFAGAILAWACAGRSPSSAVKAFYKAVANGETNEAIALFSKQTIATVGKDKLRAGIQEATRNALAQGGIQELQITDEKIAGDVANVTVLIKYGNGTQESEEVQLVKEIGWRLQPEK
jgi:Domain of unknown function (DUF4878)